MVNTVYDQILASFKAYTQGITTGVNGQAARALTIDDLRQFIVTQAMTDPATVKVEGVTSNILYSGEA